MRIVRTFAHCLRRTTRHPAHLGNFRRDRRQLCRASTQERNKQKISRNPRLAVLYELQQSATNNNWQCVSQAFQRCVQDDGTTVWKKLHVVPLLEKSKTLRDVTSTRNPKDKLLAHLLPVGYPASVSPSYGKYAMNTFIASVAGSASMVLSTQSLLLAIGVVGMNATQAGILAGAVNWVLKDGLSQAGAILWTSFSARNYDDHPKMWRMVAAITLDLAAAIELISPLLTETKGAVLAAACAAGTLKNVGFLTASASRAALHQALSQQGRNLADVTAKAGSQSIVAGLLGTTLGLGVSNVLQERPDVLMCYGVCFIGLASIHQTFNFFAVKSVAFDMLDLQRAQLVLDRLVSDGTIMDPEQVAKVESILRQALPHDEVVRVGVGIDCHPHAIVNADSRYLISQRDRFVYLTFTKEASPADQVAALYHATLLRKGLSTQDLPQQQKDLLQKLADAGWNIERTEIEPRGHCVRISVEL